MCLQGFERFPTLALQPNLVPESEEPGDFGHYSFFAEITEDVELPGQTQGIMDIQSIQDWFPAVEEEPCL
ncbi:hypothetical protein [Candidatus Contubernalis alkaliaceticus]|uniref:hypothetical protein n=1 Tax=Candidatus Contubernalis alkaliaceticus TaxID=338645 RepID=UPI001F4C163E|nr:hypothetical protein [Candidatus Contubernalis alkalaceticus]UNC91905.1 hypothetical protein HUE98_07230 [Candidatus Contubernalis alkalaceticus]